MGIGLHIFYSTYFPLIFKNKYNFVNLASIDGIFYFFIVTGFRCKLASKIKKKIQVLLNVNKFCVYN